MAGVSKQQCFKLLGGNSFWILFPMHIVELLRAWKKMVAERKSVCEDYFESRVVLLC